MSGFDNDFSYDEFDVNPNPFNDYVQIRTIASNDNQDVHIQMFDAMGKVVHDEHYTVEHGPNQIDINTSLFSQGVYYFVIDNGINTITEKMILMR